MTSLAENPLAGTNATTLSGKVMVVDDNPANLKLMEEILRPRGYEVISFPRGRLALRAAADSPPDLILLDINMPEMSGYQVCEQLKASEQLSSIPVIFLSALNAPEDRLKGFQSGGVDYVSKPFQFEEVQARVETHVKLRQLQKEVESENDRLQAMVRLQIGKVADAQMETIFAIAKLAESRDIDTGRHLERIQTFSGLLAVEMKAESRYRNVIDGPWIRNIFHASPLHDIGKVATPDRILVKPGALTPEEFAVMKNHAALGAQTLRTVHERYPDNEFIAMGIDIAQSHHEWWDGSGYPDGLRGEQIPLCARIVAVADFYDAVRAKRCYKPARTHEETCGLIFAACGTHFDPEVLDVFRGLTGTYRDVWDQMAQSDPPDDGTIRMVA